MINFSIYRHLKYPISQALPEVHEFVRFTGLWHQAGAQEQVTAVLVKIDITYILVAI